MKKNRTPRLPRSEKKADTRPTHIQAADAREQQDIRYYFQQMVQHVRWIDFRKSLSVETFTDLRKLATYDLYTDADEVQKSEWLMRPEIELKDLRKMPEFKKIKSLVAGAMEMLDMPVLIKDHLDDPLVQDRVFRETVSEALYGIDDKARSRAKEAILERMSPRAAQASQTVNLIVGAEMVERLRETIDQVRQIKEIDGIHQYDNESGSEGDEGGGEEKPLLLPPGPHRA